MIPSLRGAGLSLTIAAVITVFYCLIHAEASEYSFCNACGYHLQDLSYLFLDFPTSKLSGVPSLALSIFD